jgi:hypothetical protein
MPDNDATAESRVTLQARLAGAQFHRALTNLWQMLPPQPWVRAAVVSIACTSFSFVLYAPNLWEGACDSRCQDVLAMAESPLAPAHLNWPLSAYRVSTPILAHLLQLRGMSVLAVPIASNILALGLLFHLLSKFLPPMLTGMTALAFALTQFTQVGNTWLGWPDPLSNVALLAIMLARNELMIAAAVALGGLNDERFLVALPLALGWHLSSQLPPLTAKKILLTIAPVALGLIAVGVTRHAITIGSWGQPVPQTVYDQVAPFVYFLNFWHKPLAAFFAFRWLWLIPIVAVRSLWDVSRIRGFTYGTLIAASCFVLTLPGDMTRSMMAAFPIFLIGLRSIAAVQIGTVRRLVPAVNLLNVITPMLNVYLLSIWPIYPLPAVLARLLLGRHTL